MKVKESRVSFGMEISRWGLRLSLMFSVLALFILAMSTFQSAFNHQSWGFALLIGLTTLIVINASWYLFYVVLRMYRDSLRDSGK